MKASRSARVPSRKRCANLPKGPTTLWTSYFTLFRLTIEQFKFTNPVFYSDLMKYPRIMRYFEEDKKKSQKQFREFLHRGIGEGYFREDVNYDLIIYILSAQERYIMMSQLYNMYSMEEIFYNLIFISLRGICTNKGIEVLDGFLINIKS